MIRSVAVLLVVSACTASHTVVIRQAALANPDGCFRACQPVRGGGQDNYLNCLRACPDVEVDTGRACGSAPGEQRSADQVCMVEHAFSPGRTILLTLAVSAISVFLSYAAQPGG